MKMTKMQYIKKNRTLQTIHDNFQTGKIINLKSNLKITYI